VGVVRGGVGEGWGKGWGEGRAQNEQLKQEYAVMKERERLLVK